MNFFHKAASSLDVPEIIDWKKSGKKIVGYTCSYLPPELFYAAGVLPVRLRGVETDGLDIGDAYYGPFVCSYPKRILQLAGKGRYNFLDGAVITPGCDAMRRLDECWRKAGDDHPGILPGFFHFFDAPHKDEAHGFAWFVEEIRSLMEKIREYFGVEITEERLLEAIQLYNRGRRLLSDLEALRCNPAPPVSGADAFAAVLAGSVTPRDLYTRALEKWIAQLDSEKTDYRNRKRLMLVGSVNDDIELVRLMENDSGALVVAENLCFGVRAAGGLVAETGDPVEALARRYLGESICPRMFGKYSERLARLKETIQQHRVDGVVMQNIRFCDLHGAENALFERDLEKIGVPCLRIEREYGPLVETGRIKMRIGAFIERIQTR